MNWKNTPTVNKPFRPCRTKIAMICREVDIAKQIIAASVECIAQQRPVTLYLGLSLL